MFDIKIIIFYKIYYIVKILSPKIKVTMEIFYPLDNYINLMFIAYIMLTFSFYNCITIVYLPIKLYI